MYLPRFLLQCYLIYTSAPFQVFHPLHIYRPNIHRIVHNVLPWRHGSVHQSVVVHCAANAVRGRDRYHEEISEQCRSGVFHGERGGCSSDVFLDILSVSVRLTKMGTIHGFSECICSDHPLSAKLTTARHG